MSCPNCTCPDCEALKPARRCADPQCRKLLPRLSTKLKKYCNINCNKRHLRAKRGYTRGPYARQA